MAFLGVYRAIYDYAPQSEEELEIKEGDLLFVLEKSTEDDWWKAKKKAATDDDDEPEGLIPNNYVDEAKPISKGRAMYDYTKQTDEEVSFKEDTRVDVYDTSDSDWTLIGFNGQYGFAPAIYIETLSNASQVTENAPPPMPVRPAAPPKDDDPIPGEADYVPPSQQSTSNPQAALAGVLAGRAPAAKTHAANTATQRQRTLAAPPPMPTRVQYTPEESEEEKEEMPSLPQRPAVRAASPPPPQRVEPERASPIVASTSSTNGKKVAAEEPYSPGAFRLYNIYEMVSHMGKSKKMPTTLGLNIAKGIISISPEQRNDGPSFEWTAEKLTHYSIEGKHVFMELIRPNKSVDFHAGAKDTAKEIVALLGELAGAVRQEGLREVLAASAGTGQHKNGTMLYEHMALGSDEVTVAAGDQVIILDDTSQDEWWRVRRLRNGKEGVVPSSYVEVTGVIDRGESVTGLNAARETVAKNRLEEQRLAREALKKNPTVEDSVPERGSSLAADTKKTAGKDRSKEQPKTKPNQSRVRTWTDRTGTFKVDAEFIGLRENKIHLHKLNGVKIAVPVSKMAVEDLEYVERATGASLDDDKPLSEIKRRSMVKAGAPNGTTNGATVERKPEYDWFQFFLDCGVNPQICERYAGAFARDQMGPENMTDINASLLRTLGLKEGDILRVMKHLDAKFNRSSEASAGADGKPLFTDANGALLDNTGRRGRPTPSMQTSDIVSAEGLQDARNSRAASGANTPAAVTEKASGFEDDAWNVQPSRSQAAPVPASASEPIAKPAPIAVDPPRPRVNDDIAQLSLTSPPLQPTIAPAPAAVAIAQTPASASPQQPQGADHAIFEKIAALAPQNTAASRQRPQPPAQQSNGLIAPPPRAASAPGFAAPQNFGVVAPLQPHFTGYQVQNQLAPPGQSLQDLATIQRLQQAGIIPPVLGVAPQATGMYQPQMNGFVPQPTGIQAMQQNYPPLQPQPTGFIPTSQFGQAAYGGNPIPVAQQYINGAATGSPFADSAARPFTPGPPSGLQNSFVPQPTGFPQNSYGFGAQPTQGPAPQLPPQQTGGVFGPSQPIAPLIPQKTGPPPPVRFGVQGGAQPLTAQRTGRAELSRATPQNPFGF